MVESAVNNLGGLDILVNNAARQIAHDNILDIMTEQFDTTFKTNVYAMFWKSRKQPSLIWRPARRSSTPLL